LEKKGKKNRPAGGWEKQRRRNVSAEMRAALRPFPEKGGVISRYRPRGQATKRLLPKTLAAPEAEGVCKKNAKGKIEG